MQRNISLNWFCKLQCAIHNFLSLFLAMSVIVSVNIWWKEISYLLITNILILHTNYTKFYIQYIQVNLSPHIDLWSQRLSLESARQWHHTSQASWKPAMTCYYISTWQIWTEKCLTLTTPPPPLLCKLVVFKNAIFVQNNLMHTTNATTSSQCFTNMYVKTI